MANVDELLDQIGGLTLTEAADLVKKMEDKFGISTAAAPVAVAAAPGAGGGDAGGAEDTNFNVVLDSFGDKKIDVIKAVREITGLGWIGVPATTLGLGISFTRLRKLEGAGAKVSLKPV